AIPLESVMTTTLRLRGTVTRRRCEKGVYRPGRTTTRGFVIRLFAAEIEPGRLELRVTVERVEALVAPEAGLLVATERHRDVGGVEGVDVDDAGTDPTRQAMGSIDVARPQPGGQAVRRVVGDGQALVLVVEVGHGQDRAEDLLACDAHGVGDAGEDGRRDVVAARLLADA